MNTPAPIDEHALLVAVRQNARIARLAEPLQAYWVGMGVSTAITSFVIALRFLCLPSVLGFSWAPIISGLQSE